MTTMTHTAPATYGGNPIEGWTHGLLEAIRRHRVYLKTVAELEALNDRELADIGISRLNVRDIARDAAAMA
jgi:uncharacterized protein YjiS (DUF1127 family)